MHFFPRGRKAWCFGLTAPNSKVIASWVEIPRVKVNEGMSQGTVILESWGLMVVQSQGMLQRFNVNLIAVTNPEASTARQQFIICLLAFVANMMGHEPSGSVKWGTSGKMTLRSLMGRAIASLLSTTRARWQQDPPLFCSDVLAILLSCKEVCCLSCRFSIQHHPWGLPPSPQVPLWFSNLQVSHFPANYSLAHSWAPDHSSGT